jgi:hypothetical protein
MARRSKKSTRPFATVYRWLPIQRLQNEIPQKNALIAIIPLREMNAQHYRYTVLQYVAAVWNEGFCPKFLQEVGPLGRILSIN